MTEYMLMFSLGSAQPFIEQARKTRDLWQGSYILAKLMEAAMKDVEKLASEFVFPTNREVTKKYASLTNKYIAIFKSKQNARQAVELSRKGINNFWSKLAQDVLDKIINDHATQETLEIWTRQTNPDNFFDVFWVIVERKADEKYSDWLKRTQAALDARKNTRDFLPVDEPGEKSAVSGERQALHGGISLTGAPTRKQVQQFWINVAKRTGTQQKALSPKDISHDGSERLDAIDTIKRFAARSRLIDPKADEEPNKRELAFPSTSSVATASFVERLLTVDAAQLQTWRNATREKTMAEMPPEAIPYLARLAENNKWILKRDGDCYFEATFTPRRLEKDYALGKSEASRIAIEGMKGLKELLTITDELSIRRPTPYYAAIKMDGDRMGILLNNVEDSEEHKNISTALSEFALKLAPSFVEDKYPGRLVYSGGDDVLALVPLARDPSENDRNKPDYIHTFLNLVDRLQQGYCEHVQNAVSQARNQLVTASTGIVIAHHYTALSAVLRTVRETEKLAKRRYGRNALVVTVMRRSGEQTQVGCHWHYENLPDNAQPVKLFSRLYELFEQDILSPKCVFNLLEEAPILARLDLDAKSRREAQISEVRRILLRQTDKRHDKAPPDEEISDLAECIVDLAIAMDKETDKQHKDDEHPQKSVYLHDDKVRYGLVETLGWLQVMAFLTRKGQD